MSTTPRQTPPLFSPAPAPRGRDLTALWLIALAITCAIALALQLYHFWPHMAETAQNLLGISATVAAIARPTAIARPVTVKRMVCLLLRAPIH